MAKTPADIRSLARKHTKTALNTLVQIAASPEANDGARVAAANALLDRGYGKPSQPIAGDAENPIKVAVDVTWNLTPL